jgi:hypothetical protein
MSITFHCASCDHKYVVGKKLAGKRVRCKVCGRVQRVPLPAEPRPDHSVYGLVPEPQVPSPPLELGPSREDGPKAVGLTDAYRFAILEESRVQGIASALLLLGAADLFLTFLLLRKSPAFFESNPVAQWFFARWNMMGMVLFKFAVLGFAITASEIIERRRPGWGQSVLLIGCVATAFAIYKGYTLYLGKEPPPIALAD